MSSSPSSSRRAISSSISNGTCRPPNQTIWAARSMRACPAAISSLTSSSGSTTGSRPILVQLLKKMSAKLGATIARKP